MRVPGPVGLLAVEPFRWRIVRGDLDEHGRRPWGGVGALLQGSDGRWEIKVGRVHQVVATRELALGRARTAWQIQRWDPEAVAAWCLWCTAPLERPPGSRRRHYCDRPSCRVAASRARRTPLDGPVRLRSGVHGTRLDVAAARARVQAVLGMLE